ncbi:Imm8 family immunity protein [Neorhizobium alkalisoli]|uniref:Immunity protein 8 of polymorphic toxin system n=1 Tax=Neorhizobium alkalisoli TaxID=528178 RepID=A0A561QHF7_9HYPH|nr:Imm8 family immunity protein [Neorhizobium alkalisoli]TWF49772.1 immunity protein 8 of polymorphic toxin system [Neorhizobium alkalisoli]
MLELRADIIVAISAGETFDIEMDGSETIANVSSDDADIWLQLAIGPKGADWTETFSVRVVTPNRVPFKSDETRIIRIHRYSHDTLLDYLRTAVAACERDTWEGCLEALRVKFLWEWDTPNARKRKR